MKYHEIHKKNLKIYDINEKDLKGFTTTEKDRKRGYDKFPPLQFRNMTENVCEEQTEESKEEPPKEMGYDEALAMRKQQQEEGQNLKENPEEEDPDEDDEIKESLAGGQGSPNAPQVGFMQVHKNAKKEDAKLEDFEMMRIVGKGTFGKVFQVMHRKTKKIYAMKCIRKDVVLENEQMDSLKLEKEILYSIEHPFIVGMEYVFENNLRIFFLMDFIEGGELFRHLVQVRRFPED